MRHNNFTDFRYAPHSVDRFPVSSDSCFSIADASCIVYKLAFVAMLHYGVDRAFFAL